MAIATGKTIVITSGTSWFPPADAVGVPLRITCIGSGGDGGLSGGFPDPGPNGNPGALAIKYRYVVRRGPVSINLPAHNDNTACWFNSATTVAAASGNGGTTVAESTDSTSANGVYDYLNTYDGHKYLITDFGYGGAGEDTVNTIPPAAGGPSAIIIHYHPSMRRVGIV